MELAGEASVTGITKMEDTMTTDTSETPQPDKVRKRRSSIFQNKSTALINNTDQEIVDTGICQEREPPATAEEVDSNKHECHNSAEEEFDLAQYISSLKEERTLWKNIAAERKSERRKLMIKKTILEREGQPLDLNVLSDEERAFVRDAPNYQLISEECNQLTREAIKIGFLNELAFKQNTYFIAQLTEGLDRTTKQIIEKSQQ